MTGTIETQICAFLEVEARAFVTVSVSGQATTLSLLVSIGLSATTWWKSVPIRSPFSPPNDLVDVGLCYLIVHLHVS